MVVVIDDPNRCRPQPTSCTILFLKVINENMSLINPAIINIHVRFH